MLGFNQSQSKKRKISDLENIQWLYIHPINFGLFCNFSSAFKIHLGN